MQKRTDIAPTQPLDQASLDLAQALGLVRTQVGVISGLTQELDGLS